MDFYNIYKKYIMICAIRQLDVRNEVLLFKKCYNEKVRGYKNVNKIAYIFY